MITIENLTKYYGDSCAVDNISFEIRKGEILGLLGPNGAGKTTTMRILTCYLRPTSGSVRVKDFTIHDNPVEIKRLIGYLPESAPLYPDMIVLDFLKFVADLRSLGVSGSESRIRELAGMCGIREVMHKSISELSKGYKQRVGLAHAMMNDPEILVLDEPTSGLDPNQIVEIRDIIREIGKEKTVILSTHILSEAEATCDRIVIINRGSIVADGSTEELKRESGSEYQLLVTLRNVAFDDVKSAFEPLAEVSDIHCERDEDGEMEFSMKCGGAQDLRPNIYEIIRNSNWSLLEFRKQSQTLETIFRELTREG